MKTRTATLMTIAALSSCASAQRAGSSAPSAAALVEALVQQHGEAARPRAERGVKQVLALWRSEDGDAAALESFVRERFVSDPAALAALLGRYEEAFEQLDGHLLEMGRALRSHSELELGPQLPIDDLFASFSVGAHLGDDLFRSKLAFIVLLNFTLPTLEELQREGPSWSRQTWAEARLAKRFATRISAEAAAEATRSSAEGEAYIAGYNLWVHHLLSGDGSRPFARGKRLLSHWNLRDEIKAQYAEGAAGLQRQRLLAAAMEHIVDQSIPLQVIDDQRVDWNPLTNQVALAPPAETEERPKDMAAPKWAARAPDLSGAREPDTRYERLLANFHAAQKADAGSPLFPTFLDRRFQLDSELPVERVVGLLEEVASSPILARLAKLIEKRLGRLLEPFDIWYSGFLQRNKYPEQQLDELTRAKYPTAEDYHRDMPRLFQALGFAPEKAAWLAQHIVVDPARGSGHALQAARRGDFPHLRTRVGKDGMDYKGYNIAVHEMGHNVEQCFSLYEVDHTLLSGVPTTAFTEALAFTFQARDLELLGLTKPDERSERLRVLNDVWATYEIAGPALVDIAAWRWLYAHPDANAAQLRAAVVDIVRDTWDRL